MKRSRTQYAELKLSSKRQVTLPAGMVKEMGLEPGDKLAARLDNGSIVLLRRPADWLEYITGGRDQPVYGRTKEEVDAYIRDIRSGWDRRARVAEGGSYQDESS